MQQGNPGEQGAKVSAPRALHGLEKRLEGKNPRKEDDTKTHTH